MKAAEAARYKFTKGGYFFYHIRKTYTPTESGKNFKSKPDAVKEEVISTEHYNNFLSWSNFFNSFRNEGGSYRVTQSYTTAGYIPTHVTSVAPYRSKKESDYFEPYALPARYKLGYREKAVLDNLTDIQLVQNDGSYFVVRFLAEIDGETKTFEYDYISGTVTN